MSFYKGYVPTKNKKCLMTFKNKESKDLLTLDQVKDLPEYAGVLENDTIMIDVDDYEQSEILMKIVEEKELLCRVYETKRGKHFLFKNTKLKTCKTHTKLACGLTADIKVGFKNSYDIIKFDGVERKILYDIFEDEEYQEIPKFLWPVKTKVDFVNLEEGDGRNQTLFNYILTLQSNDFTKEQARETIRIINDYVLKNPLEQSELETILRDESFQKESFYKGNTFLFDKFANFLKNTYHIIKINGQLHLYDEGIYVSGWNVIESKMIKHIPTLSAAKRTEVIKYLELLVPETNLRQNSDLIAFQNGVYNFATDSLEEFSPDKIILNKINWFYDPEAYCEITDKTLNKIACNDPNIRMLLEEVIGYTFYCRNELRKAFVLVGDKANGKSTYLDMIKTLLGDVNTCALDLSELGERFKTAELFGKLANIGDDIGDDFIANPAIFKKLVSGDRLNAERKGQNPFDFNNYSKMLFSANSIPRIKDKTGAVIDRLVIIPFNAVFSSNDPDYDPYIKYKLRSDESMRYLLRIGIEGLRRVLETRMFTTSKQLQAELQEYAESNNPILLFFKEVEEKELVNNPTKDAFRKYQEFCIVNNFQPMSNIEFSKQVKKHFDFDITNKKIDGIKYRIFVKKEE